MTKVVVFHRYYGCDTGCCGHAIMVDGEEVNGSFDFTHAGGTLDVEFAKQMVRDELGEEHVKDLDWESCIIEEDHG